MKLPYLVVLDLSHSWELSRLREDDGDIQLPMLQTLDLRGCGGLEELAENFGQSVPRLKRLEMGDSMRLRRLPESIGLLTDLEHLDLSMCKELVSLPDGMVGLVSLRSLDLCYSVKLQALPEEFGKLTNLETVDLLCCGSLSALPTSIGGLEKLQTLRMTCFGVEDLAAEFFEGVEALTSVGLCDTYGHMGCLGALTALKDLRIDSHKTITTLPKSLGNLKFLVHLEMWYCPDLSTVEALPEGLERLYLSGCGKVREIPSLAGMWSLVEVDLEGCRSLRHLHGVGKPQ